MNALRTKAAVVALVVGCAIAGIAGCEVSQLASRAVSGAPLRADQIVLQGPITICECYPGRDGKSMTLPADDLLVARLNDWAKQSLAGARVSVVNYAPSFTVTGENFKMNFTGSGVVLDLWPGESPGGCWLTHIEAESDPMLKILRARLAASQ